MNFFEIIAETFAQSGFAAFFSQPDAWKQGVMLLISFLLLYMAIVKKFEPLLLVPIAFGMLLANLPAAGMMFDATAAPSQALAMAQEALKAGTGSVEAVNAAAAAVAGVHWYDSGVLRVIYSGVKSSLFPCLIFMGVGAMTDFGPLLANPASLLLGAAAQLGIYVAYVV
ncbi:MAG: sodium ion-translocating decarboxylase subunit beta, partial [Angelakisella sp.]